LRSDSTPVSSVCFSSDSRFLAYGGGWPNRLGTTEYRKLFLGDKRDQIPADKADLFIWDEQLKRRVPLKGHSKGVTSVAFGLDGTRLRVAAAGHDGIVKVWEVMADGTVKDAYALPHQQGAVNAVAFSRDGKRLATAGDD